MNPVPIEVQVSDDVISRRKEIKEKKEETREEKQTWKYQWAVGEHKEQRDSE